jgi:acyl carrier protein
MKKKLYKILQSVDSRIKIKDKTKNLEVGKVKFWDSLSHLNFLLAVEEKFKIRFTIDEMTNIKTINQIELALSKRKTHK